MVKVVHIGDLHYGFEEKTYAIISEFIKRLPTSDVLLIGGDVISHRQSQWDDVLKLISTEHPNSLKLSVLGNHDFWDMKNYQTGMTELLRKFKKNKIIYMEREEPQIVGDVAFMGFDGWYALSEPPSNDSDRIPTFLLGKRSELGMHGFFYRKAVVKKDEIEKQLPLYKKSVVLTHFEPNLHPMGAPIDWIDDLRKFEQEQLVLCVGHTHHKREEIDGKFRLYNHGSDYNFPAYIEFSV